MAFWLREIHRSGQVLLKLGNIRRKSLVKEPQEVAGEGVQNLLLYKLRGQVIKDPVAARQLPVVQIAQEPGLGGAVQVAVLMAEYMDVIVVDEIEALIFSEHAAVADTQVNHSFSFEISM